MHPKLQERKSETANPAMMMENFNPPNLDLNTDINEAQSQLNASLQDMLDKCVPEKMVKRPKKTTKCLVQ